MISVQQATQGISQYLDAEVLPHLSGAKKVGAGIYIALALQNAAKTVDKFKSHPAVAMLNIIDDKNMVDIDALYQVAFPMFAEKQRITVPLLGEMFFDQQDVEKIYRYMKGA